MPSFDGIERQDLLAALIGLGCAAPMPMGGWIPLPYSELEAFGRTTRRISDPWEYETLREMSVAYVSGLVEGRDLFSIMPVERG